MAADDKAVAADQEQRGTDKPEPAATPTPKNASTPLPGTASGSAPANEASIGSVFSSPDMTAAVLAYLHRRGFDRVEAAFKAELYALASGATAEQAAAAADLLGRAPTVGLEDLAVKNAPRTLADKDGKKDKD